MSMHLDPSVCREVRRRCGLCRSRCPVRVVAGPQAPCKSGEAGYAEFKDGGRVRSYGAARQAGYRVRYVRSTLCVTVGDVWLAAEMGIVGPLAERLGLRADVPLAILADFCADFEVPGAELLPASAPS